MIELKAMPFDSKEILNEVTGETIYDRVAYSRDLADWMREYFGNGILVKGKSVIDDELKVTHKSGLTVQASPGSIIINGRTGWLENITELAIEMGGVQPRIDRVIAELNLENRDIQIKVLQGIAAASPTPPVLTKTEDVYQMSLAQLSINANAAVIASVTDERSDETVCGISNVLIGIKPPTGNDAATVKLDEETKALYSGVDTVDEALNAIKKQANRLDARIVTGTYTGNGTASRFIYLGFTPRAVRTVKSNGSAHTTNNSAYWSTTYYGGVAFSNLPCYIGDIIILDIKTNGFWVYYKDAHSDAVGTHGYVRTNSSDSVYYYIAIR